MKGLEKVIKDLYSHHTFPVVTWSNSGTWQLAHNYDWLQCPISHDHNFRAVSSKKCLLEKSVTLNEHKIFLMTTTIHLMTISKFVIKSGLIWFMITMTYTRNSGHNWGDK